MLDLNSNIGEKIICAIVSNFVMVRALTWSLIDDGRRTHGEQIDRTFTTKLLPLAVLLSLLALTTKFWQRIPLNNTSNFEYAVVLDAGSTGSRVLGFTFQRDPETQSLRLLDELWMQVKPGLSAYHVSLPRISYFTIEWSSSRKTSSCFVPMHITNSHLSFSRYYVNDCCTVKPRFKRKIRQPHFVS